MAIVIGLTGHAGCGKGTAAEYLVERYGFRSFTMSDVIRAEATKRGLLEGKNMEEEKMTLLKFGKEWRRETKREDIVGWTLIGRIKMERLKHVVVDGFRSVKEVGLFRKEFKNFVLVRMEASEEKRWERRLAQDPESERESFDRRDRADVEKLGLGDVLTMADETVNNNGTKEELYRQLDSILSRFDRD